MFFVFASRAGLSKLYFLVQKMEITLRIFLNEKRRIMSREVTFIEFHTVVASFCFGSYKNKTRQTRIKVYKETRY